MHKYLRRLHLNFAFVSLFVIGAATLTVPVLKPIHTHEDNFYLITLAGEPVGYTASKEEAEHYLRIARRRIAKSSDEMLFIDAPLAAEGREVFWGQTDREETIVDNMVQVLSSHEERTMERCYTLKMGEYTIHMQSLEDIRTLLLTALEKYDNDSAFAVRLVPDESREISVMTTQVLSTTEKEQQDAKAEDISLPLAGIEAQLSEFFDAVTPHIDMDFDDYEKGLQAIDFDEKIEICEAYMPANQITSLEDAIRDVNGEVDRSQFYEVQYGDSPFGIADKFGISLAQLCAINDSLDIDNPQVMVGDNLIVTVQQPKLAIDYTIRRDYEEEYTANTIYKKNDAWYTTRSEVIQNAVTGKRRVIADVSYRDSLWTGSNIIKQETITEAVPQIIEIGTVNPPTYIWPVATGYVSSNFGRRSRPKAGASTYHQGVDIGLGVGTTVRASSGGTVTAAGWQGGYGNVVYIDHGDGRQTRYGHLSRITVSVGEKVSQGERIALSGNTGNSTGPHLHFELRINGTAVNPLNYISR